MADPDIDLVRLVLRQRGSVCLAVTGNSMWPTLCAGATVEVTRVDLDEVRPGQVVAFQCGRKILVHRVAHAHDEHLVTGGDNLPLYDPPVRRGDLLGRINQCPPAPVRPWLSLPPGLDPPGDAGCHLWLVGHRSDLAGAGPALPDRPRWSVHPRARQGVGVSPQTLAEMRAASRGRLRVGVSEYAVLPVAALERLPAEVAAHVFVGCSFGGQVDDPDGGVLLPPNLADIHVRAGEALTPVDPIVAAALVSGHLHRAAGQAPGRPARPNPDLAGHPAYLARRQR